MILRFVLTTALVLTTIAMAPAQSIPKQPPPVSGGPLGQGDAKERAACHPDVVRFCKELIKDDANADVFGILSGLQTEPAQIGNACNEVLASHGQ